MTPRERVQAVLSGGVPDRVPVYDGYWWQTIERWRREGMPADISPAELFGFDIAPLAGFDYSLQLPTQVLETAERYRVIVDANGATRTEMGAGAAATSSWLDFTIKGPHDWRRLSEQATFNPSRIWPGIMESYRSARDQDKFVVYMIHSCFHPTWHKVGMENLLVWFHEEPELVADMFQAHTQLVMDLYDATKAMGIEYDGAWMADDLGFRTAPLISPAMYRDAVMPYHKQVCDHFAADGLKTMLHSDGNVAPLIPHFLDAGFGALHPLEAKADLDVRTLKPQYGDRLVLFGNIDVRKLAGSRAEIEEEIGAKVTAAKQGGGYIYHSDHSVPPDVSYENYQFALEMVRHYGA